MSGTDELTAFLRARYDEREAARRHAGNGRIAWLTYLLDNGELSHTTVAADHHDGYWCAGGKLLPEPASVLIVYDQAEVLADLAAKRGRLTLMAEATAEMDRLLADDTAGTVDQAMAIGRARGATVAVKYDATVYASHPGYQARWKP